MNTIYKNNKPSLLFVMMVIMSFFDAVSQQLPFYTNYTLNQVVLNPATAGAYGYMGANMSVRNDWSGFEGSPSTFTLSGEYRLNKSTNLWGGRSSGAMKGNIGLGAVFFSDNNGPMTRNGFKAIYAYHINLGKSQLSMGLGISGYQLKVDMDKINFINESDPLVMEMKGNSSVFSPDASFGVYLNHVKYFVGLASDQLMQNSIRFGESNIDMQMLRHYYLVGGYCFDINQDIYIEPSLLFKYNERFNVQTDFTVKAVYQDSYWLGMNLRSNNDFAFLFGVRYLEYYLAYSYDFSSNPVLNYSFTSHELNLGYRLNNNKRGRGALRERY